MGIGYFPSSHPDELFYSLCARYHDRVRYIKTGVSSDLFGNRNAFPHIAIPYYLRHFNDALPPSHTYSVKRVAEEHTFFPLCRPFLKPDMFDGLLQLMAGSTPRSRQSFLMILKGLIRASRRLRYCPGCVEEDRARLGETYWHRLHQVVGVEVCPTHNLFLENSDVYPHARIMGKCYVPADRVVMQPLCRALDPADVTHQCLLRAARDTAWLIGWRDSQPTPESVLNAYMSGLGEKGFLKRSASIRKIRQEALNAAFVDFFPAPFLRLYNLNAGGGFDYPHRFLRGLLRGQPGLLPRHLMMLQFLGHPAESFFIALAESSRARGEVGSRPFGKAPWPCLNPAASHVRELTVESCSIGKSVRGNDLPMGTFSCRSCGFVYRRTGPDTAPKDRLRFDSIRAYGPVWEEALKTYWADPSLTVVRMASRLGVTPATVRQQAFCLGLPFPRLGPRCSVTKAPRKTPKTNTKRRQVWLETRAKNRRWWLRALKQNPGITRTALAGLRRRTYSWLYTHDREWLEKHKPPSKYAGGGRPLNWARLDPQIAGEVRSEADRVKRLPGRPVRVTKSLIAKNINRFNAVMGALDKLPATAAVLTEVVESQRDFDIRRLERAARQLISEGAALNKTSLLRRAFSYHPGVDKVPAAEAVLQYAHKLAAEPMPEAA